MTVQLTVQILLQMMMMAETEPTVMTKQMVTTEQRGKMEQTETMGDDGSDGDGKDSADSADGEDGIVGDNGE